MVVHQLPKLATRVRFPLPALVLLLLAAGCAGTPTTRTIAVPTTPQALPQLSGSYHTVQRGESLWGIARSYGLEPAVLAKTNRISTTTSLPVGQKLFIPLPRESTQFVWPIRGRYRIAGGSALEIDAPSGSLIRASRSGQVAVAARHVPGLGKIVILDHRDGYVSVYGGLEQVLVSPATSVRQGMPIGSLGPAHLHFEIRYQTRPRNALALLPRE